MVVVGFAVVDDAWKPSWLEWHTWLPNRCSAFVRFDVRGEREVEGQERAEGAAWERIILDP